MCRWRNSETFRVKGGEDPTPCPHQAGTSGGGSASREQRPRTATRDGRRVPSAPCAAQGLPFSHPFPQTGFQVKII